MVKFIGEIDRRMKFVIIGEIGEMVASKISMSQISQRTKSIKEIIVKRIDRQETLTGEIDQRTKFIGEIVASDIGRRTNYR